MADEIDRDRPYVTLDTSDGTSALEDSVVRSLESAGFVVGYDEDADEFIVQHQEMARND